jgi:hypothetical protein
VTTADAVVEPVAVTLGMAVARGVAVRLEDVVGECFAVREGAAESEGFVLLVNSGEVPFVDVGSGEAVADVESEPEALTEAEPVAESDGRGEAEAVAVRDTVAVRRGVLEAHAVAEGVFLAVEEADGLCVEEPEGAREGDTVALCEPGGDALAVAQGEAVADHVRVGTAEAVAPAWEGVG